jgi:hypothetical protein
VGGVLARSALRSLALLLAIPMLLSLQGCSRDSTAVVEGVIVGIEAHVPGRPVSLTIDPSEGERTTIALPDDGGYGVPTKQLYDWLDERRVVKVTYEPSEAGGVLTSIRPVGTE